MIVTRPQASVIENPKGSTIKRIAWVYGCAKAGSDIETELLRILIEKIRSIEP
jgi:hypothetical protein